MKTYHKESRMMEFSCNSCGSVRPFGIAEGQCIPVNSIPFLSCDTCKKATPHTYCRNRTFHMSYDRMSGEQISNVVFV